MSDTHTFERLFRWDAWANDRVLYALRALDAPPPKAVDRMAHLVRAGELWLSRLSGGEWDANRALFPERADLKQVSREAQTLAARWTQYTRVLSPADLAQTIPYNSTEGAPFETRVEDILLHVTHHAAYHRGQIPLDLKNAGAQLPEGVTLVTDYIFFARADIL